VQFVLPSTVVRKFPIDGGLLLLDTNSHRLFAYNETARQVWDLVETAGSSEDVVNSFAAACGISRSLAQSDVSAILTEWRSLGFFSPDGATRPLAQPVPTARGSSFALLPRRNLEWTSTIRNTTIRFVADSDVAVMIHGMFKHVETPGAPPNATFEIINVPGGLIALVEDGVERICTANPAQIVGAVWQATLEKVHSNVRWLALIHGGAVARHGEAIGICGPSGSGKTTLIAALIGNGFHYLADDMISLATPDGAVIPLPVPLSVKPGSLEALSSIHPGLASAARYRTKGVEARLLEPPPLAWDLEPVPLRKLVFPRFVDGAAATQRQISSFDAVARLLAERIWLGNPITERQVVDLLAWLANTEAFAIEYGKLDDGLRLIEDIAK
jgi:hypothetical protein